MPQDLRLIDTSLVAAARAGERAAFALAALPPGQRAVQALRHLEGLRMAEVAVALDIPPGADKARSMHAHANLRADLEGNDNGQT